MSYQRIFVFVVATLFWGCTNDKTSEEADEQSQRTVALYPPAGGQGTSMAVDFDATGSIFSFTGTEVDFGEGITVSSVTVNDGWGARAQVMIDPDAALGVRDVSVTTDGSSYSIPQSFEVVAESFIVDPTDGKMGEIIEVGLLGSNTNWVSGVTWPNFGEGIEVLEFTVFSETLAQALISIDANTSPGWRNITVDSGGTDYTVLYQGFKVDRVGLGAVFDPVTAEQGRTVEFTVRARGTDFTASTPRLSFYDRFGENPDIVVEDVTVLDAENLYGRMTLSNAAALGMRDVMIDMTDDSVRIPDAFEVLGGDWDLSEVAIDLDFYVFRELNPDSCEVFERVVARAIFFIPLDPPCGGGGMGSPPPGPSPYDNNGVFELPSGESGEADDCPFPTTLGAGDYVWFESDANIVTLEKVYDSSTGQIYYEGIDLTMDDYVAGYNYDLHTQGEEGGLGEYLLEGVQPTVPGNWYWLTPDLCRLTHNRADDFPFTWTPALTYPDAMFSVSIYGNIEATGNPGFAGTLPWDDGEHSFTAGEMSQLEAGPVSFQAYSFIEGPLFGLPESIFQENQSDSYIVYVTSFNLE